ncbi:CAAX prenyl protease-like protein [Algoriphagus ratkowskyi]|uniref:CAAX prenyl protease-like protein n=1 Tax=Algoriphagus ratkowskyi TaxID=57028 RepID=A0A2W7S1X8_9BACT|nr:CPBP family glutamic-type intramembrane protease [Algoriphagus ratkowskyi]PZX61347.1 CAAX prenyl protease-like protein [Algoriphagus ratkowskyi]TXD79445.1 CPBP family intramembrane metalloprotease [Algoriphagus ratkowskyi]
MGRKSFLPILDIMNEKLKFVIVFFGLIIYNFVFVDKISFHFGLEGNTKAFSSLTLISIISAIVIAPILEESIFRWVLLKNEMIKYYLYILYSLCIILFIDVNTGVILLLFFSGGLLLLHKVKEESSLIFYVFIFFGAITFSLIHIPVISGSSLRINLIIAISAFLPIGFFLSLIRTKFGLIYSILLHCVYNVIILSVNEVVY